MKMKKSLVALSAMVSLASLHEDAPQIDIGRSHSKTPLTHKQKKARAKAKRAKQARRKNRK